jgi:hypothetical protein
MRYLSFIILVLFQFSAQAQSLFSYEDTAMKLGLNIISIGKPFTFPGVHRFYTDQGFKRAMMVMENVEGKKEKLTITEFPKYTMVEYPTSENTFNSLAFVNITKTQIETFLSKPEGTVYTKIDRFLNFIIPKAHAMESCEMNSLEASMGSSLSGVSGFFSSGYFEIASSCLMGILEGMWESTGGMLESAWSGLKHLVRDPKGFWDEKVESFKKLKDFLMDFEVNMQKMFASFKKLPDETKAQMLCSFVGSIGTDIIITALTAGAGAAKLGVSIKNYVGKLVKIEGLLSKLNKLGKLKEIPAKFFDRLSKGLVSEKRLSSIQSLTHNQFDDLAMQLVRCSL